MKGGYATIILTASVVYEDVILSLIIPLKNVQKLF